MLKWTRRTALVAALSLVLAAGPAQAGYWFFQGYLPLPGGYPAVTKRVNPCCGIVNVLRLSHQCGTHWMYFVWILPSGRWTLSPTESCDQSVPLVITTSTSTGYTAAGCENPPSFFDVIWTNCHLDVT
jgi:hypothetical protein